MQPYNRHNTTPKCKQVRKCKKHKDQNQTKVSALVILFDKARKSMPISKPAKSGIHYEFSIFA